MNPLSPQQPRQMEATVTLHALCTSRPPSLKRHALSGSGGSRPASSLFRRLWSAHAGTNGTKRASPPLLPQNRHFTNIYRQSPSRKTPFWQHRFCQLEERARIGARHSHSLPSYRNQSGQFRVTLDFDSSDHFALNSLTVLALIVIHQCWRDEWPAVSEGSTRFCTHFAAIDANS